MKLRSAIVQLTVQQSNGVEIATESGQCSHIAVDIVPHNILPRSTSPTPGLPVRSARTRSSARAVATRVNSIDCTSRPLPIHVNAPPRDVPGSSTAVRAKCQAVPVSDLNVGEQDILGGPIDMAAKPVGSRLDTQSIVSSIND